MKPSGINIFTRTHLFYLMSLALLTAGPLIAEEIRLTTYYPSPFGEYDMLMANILDVDGATHLSMSSGEVAIGNAADANDDTPLQVRRDSPLGIAAGEEQRTASFWGNSARADRLRINMLRVEGGPTRNTALNA